MARNSSEPHGAEVTNRRKRCGQRWTDAARPVLPSEGQAGAHLEHGQEGLREIVEGAALGLRLVKIELAAEQLHPKQGEDDDEQKQQQQQRGDGLHGV